MKRYAAALIVLLPLLAATPAVDRNKALGNPSAPVELEVFSDFTCPHCKVFHETILPQLKSDYMVAGKVYIVDRAFPLTGAGHEHGREAANYAVAAARIDKYQQVADVLYSQQALWAMNGNIQASIAAVLSPADQKKVQALAKDPSVLAEVESEYQEGIAQGVNQTPTLIVTVGGKRYTLPPAPDYRLLKSMIDGLLPK
jgi:protein-disulfide isomerase